MKLENLNALHADPRHWHLVFFYFAPGDPRIVVRKRVGGLGWTLNFARPMAIPLLCALIALVYGFMEAADSVITSSQGYWLSVILLVLLITAFCGWVSDPRRYIDRRDKSASPGDGKP